jgi:hypothetical protein
MDTNTHSCLVMVILISQKNLRVILQAILFSAKEIKYAL